MTPFNVQGAPVDDATFKACCALAYESPAVRFVLGDSWHPGGTALTVDIGRASGLAEGDRVLDVACGYGESARALSKAFGCSVAGVDLSPAILQTAASATKEAHLDGLVTFQSGDGEALPFADDSFGLVICECSLCTFPNKKAAIAEMARVLRPGGHIVIADVTLRLSPLSEPLESLVSSILCVASALPLAEYGALLAETGLQVTTQKDCQQVALDLLKGIDQKLLMARIAQAVGKLHVPREQLQTARRMVATVRDLVLAGRLSYGYVIARKDAEP